jgi:HPt (histidine-containing phosphotransfer) domain-containing protein
MTDEIRNLLVAAGVDVDSVMERFLNNEALLERFMRKFQNDPNYKELLEAVEQKDNERAFAAAHTLKGVSGNLSLAALQKQVSDQCECFRAGEFEAGAALMPKVTAEYQRVVEALIKIYP